MTDPFKTEVGIRDLQNVCTQNIIKRIGIRWSFTKPVFRLESKAKETGRPKYLAMVRDVAETKPIQSGNLRCRGGGVNIYKGYSFETYQIQHERT